MIDLTKRILYKKKIFLKILYFISIVLLLNSCKIINSSELFRTDKAYDYTEFKKSEMLYKIQAFDKIDLRVFSNDGYKLVDLSTMTMAQATTYTVEIDGKVKLPIVGRVHITGRTIREAEDMLEELYSKYFKDPFVLVEVTNKRVVMFSAGSTQGNVLQMKGDNYSLIEAIADAGGLSDLSKSHRIKLLRGDLNNPQVYIFNIRDITEMQKANFVLQANDIIYVETRPRYSARLVSEISPYLSLISSILLVYGLFLR